MSKHIKLIKYLITFKQEQEQIKELAAVIWKSCIHLKRQRISKWPSPSTARHIALFRRKYKLHTQKKGGT